QQLDSHPPAPQTVEIVGRSGVRVSGRSAIVVGEAHDIPRALEHPAFQRHGVSMIAGVLAIESEPDSCAASGAQLDDLLKQTRASTILVAGPLGARSMQVVADIALLNRCRVLAVMPSEVVAGHDPVIVWQGDRPLVQLFAGRHSTVQYAAKRAVDVASALIGLVLLTPLSLLVGCVIKLDSRGPVLFRHRRMGRGGIEFDCLKFRTMEVGAESRLNADPELSRLYRANNFRVPDEIDPRVTRVGRFLRRTSLDELPQLINVLVGEMSLIGPRPLVQDELAHFDGSERLLLSVRPGITGMWAVSGRHAVAYPERAEIELGYVRTWSLLGDLLISLKTGKALLRYGGDPTATA
ncbi:MAG: hypothetical protein RL625_1065, partial [Gemmatimonadota bacterium]